MNAREILNDRLDEKLTAEQYDALIEGVLAITKLAWADFKCKECGQHQRHQVEIPDAVNVTRGIDLLLTQGKGKPVEHKRIEVEVGVRNLDAMTLDQLDAEEAAILEQHPELR